MNGAGTGMEAFRLLLGLLVRRRAITEFREVVLGIPATSTARLLTVATTPRTSATSTMASVLCAMRSRRVIPVQHGVIPALKGFRCCPCFDAGIPLREIARSSRAMTGVA